MQSDDANTLAKANNSIAGIQHANEEHNRHENLMAKPVLGDLDVQKFLQKELEKFGSNKAMTDNACYHIRMKDEISIKLRYNRKNPAMQTIISKEIYKLI